MMCIPDAANPRRIYVRIQLLSLHMVFFMIPIVSSQRLDAFNNVRHPRQPQQQRQNAALAVPRLDWDDDAPLPHTIETTSHYRAGSADKPGAFSVARREPWLLPAQHNAHRPHPSDPDVDPAAARHHESHTASQTTTAGWVRQSVPVHELRPRGLPPQQPKDWPLPSGSTVDTEPPGMVEDDSTTGSRASPLGDAMEWGADSTPAAVVSSTPAAANFTADATEAAATDPTPIDAATSTAAESTQRPLIGSLVATSRSDAAPPAEARDDSPRGSKWWHGERKVGLVKLVALAAKINQPEQLESSSSKARAGELTSDGKDAQGGAADEAEWQPAGLASSTPNQAVSSSSVLPATTATGGLASQSQTIVGEPSAGDRSAMAAMRAGKVPVVAVGERDAQPMVGGLAEGEIGAVYEVQYV